MLEDGLWYSSERKHRDLKNYTLDDLYENLEISDRLPSVVIACLCAEILKRTRNKEQEHVRDI